MTWQRARKPEQKQQRREALIAAAAQLFERGEYEAVSISGIAQAAGMAPSNVYHYFASKEELFLALYESDVGEWIEHVEEELPGVPARPADVAGLLAHSMAARPRLGALTALLSSVLERNISVNALTAFKISLNSVGARFLTAVLGVMPSLDSGAAQRLPNHMFAVVAGLWPMAHPAPALDDILQSPDLAHMRASFEIDLKQIITALLVGLSRGA